MAPRRRGPSRGPLHLCVAGHASVGIEDAVGNRPLRPGSERFSHRSRLPLVPCVIVFGGNDEKPLTLPLDVDADEVAKSLRGHSLQRIEVTGRVIWVNPQNVLYVENTSAPSPAE